MFYNPLKIMKLVPFILMIDGTSKQHKRMSQKFLYQSLKGFGGFKAYFECILLGVLTKSSVNPYYEPWSWYMIHIYVTGFEITHLPSTQQQDIPFSITQQLYTLTNISGRY